MPVCANTSKYKTNALIPPQPALRCAIFKFLSITHLPIGLVRNARWLDLVTMVWGVLPQTSALDCASSFLARCIRFGVTHAHALQQFSIRFQRPCLLRFRDCGQRVECTPECGDADESSVVFAGSWSRSLNQSKVVPRGLEPRTLRLLAVRSNQLSYETICSFKASCVYMSFAGGWDVKQRAINAYVSKLPDASCHSFKESYGDNE